MAPAKRELVHDEGGRSEEPRRSAATSGAPPDARVLWAYRNVSDVVDTCDGAGIGRKVARLRPIGCVKG